MLSLPEPEVVSEPEPEPEPEVVPEPEALEPEEEPEEEPDEVPPRMIMVSDMILSFFHQHGISHQGDILGQEARAILTTVAASSLGQAWAVQSRTPYS